MRPIHLDERLRTIASLVPQGSRLADVGCDHGSLICALAESGQIPGGVACDLREGPLSQARHEVALRGLGDRIDCRLGDGLSCVAENEADVVVLAGMGGELICTILSQCPWEHREDKLFLLQPMTRAPRLRRWLCENGYEIERETACVAAGHPYTVMRVRYTGRPMPLGEYDLYAYIGDLAHEPSPAAREYIRRAAVSLVRRENGVLGADAREAEQLRTLSNKMLAMIESW